MGRHSKQEPQGKGMNMDVQYEKGKAWDGQSRPSNDAYRKGYNAINWNNKKNVKKKKRKPKKNKKNS